MNVEPLDIDLVSPNLKEVLKPIKIDGVFHLAAEIATQRKKDLVWQTNHMGTKNLYEALQSHEELQKFIFSSTVVVGEAHGKVLTEDDILNVETEYGKTKQASEKLLIEAHKENKFPVCIIRPSHIYGNGGWFSGMIKDIRKGLFKIPGDGKNFWDVVHVDDVVAALIVLFKSGQDGQIYHVVDDTPTTMGDFFQEVGKLLGKKKIGHVPIWLANIIKGKDPILAGIRSAKSSNKKLRSLGWNPQYVDYRSGLNSVFSELS